MGSNKVIKIAGISLAVLAVYNLIQRGNDNPAIIVKKKLMKGFNAQTIPPFGIFITEAQKNNISLIEHEMMHWKQYQKKGLIVFYYDYYNELKTYGYDKMPMEIEARFRESDYCKLNYTDCVRSGKSVTVFNPNFRDDYLTI